MAYPTLTQVPPERPLSTIKVFAPYHPEARRALPLPPLPPPITMKSYVLVSMGAMVEYGADEGICLDKEARREDTDEAAEICRAAEGLRVDEEESRAELICAAHVNVLRVVVFRISEYACDGRLGMTWGKRTSIDADAKSREGGYIQKEGEEGRCC